LSPAIRLGAERILAIGVRYRRTGSEVKELNQQVHMDSIVLSDIAGIMFNSLFLDAIEFDFERLQRINQTVELLTEEIRLKHPVHLKKIPTLLIQPSIDLGAMASDQFDRFPRMLRHLLAGIGASKERGADLLSYIAFDKAYTKKLVETGIKDAHGKRKEIKNFFSDESV
jgi:NTE family protein